MNIDIFNCKDRKYSIIYSDPPWAQKKGGLRKCRPNQDRNIDYKTLSLSDIKEIHQKALELTEEKHNIFLWTVDKFLWDAEDMFKSLGYTLHARFIWDKTNGIAPAFTVRFSHEYLLWFYSLGNMLKPCKEARGVYKTVFSEPSTIHSKKPVFAYEMIEAMFPNTNKLELFARNHRDGWDCFGNETSKIDNI